MSQRTPAPRCPSWCTWTHPTFATVVGGTIHERSAGSVVLSTGHRIAARIETDDQGGAPVASLYDTERLEDLDLDDLDRLLVFVGQVRDQLARILTAEVAR